MMRATVACCFLVTFLACFAADHRPSDLKSLYEAHRCFQLRDAIRETNASALYRGAVESAFNEPRLAQKDLQSVIESARHSEEVYQAHEVLTRLFLRAGHYQQVLLQNEAMLAAKPDDADAKNYHALFAILGQYPDQRLTQRYPSTLRYRMDGGNMFVPLSINGKSANYIVDTGMNLSTISESETKRLNLTVHEVGAKAHDEAGRDVDLRVAVADRLNVGEVHLRNVAFLVVRDYQEPFVNLRTTQRGILGLPVLLAFETLRWNTDGTFQIGFHSKGEKNIRKSNLCFEDANLIVEATFRQSSLTLILDTGAATTTLWPNFAKDFAHVIKESGKMESAQITAMGGSVTYHTISLPELSLRLGGFDTVLRPAHVFLTQATDEGQRYYGNLGLDLLNQARMVTIDFNFMNLSLE